MAGRSIGSASITHSNSWRCHRHRSHISQACLLANLADVDVVYCRPLLNLLHTLEEALMNAREIGGAIGGAIGGTVAAGYNLLSKGADSDGTGNQEVTRTPSRGAPNSVEEVKPGQWRKFGPDGRAEKDLDTGHDHGGGDPHVHDWDWGKTPPRSKASRPLRPGEAEEFR